MKVNRSYFFSFFYLLSPYSARLCVSCDHIALKRHELLKLTVRVFLLRIWQWGFTCIVLWKCVVSFASVTGIKKRCDNCQQSKFSLGLFQLSVAKCRQIYSLVKARLHRRFLSRQLDAIFLAPKLHRVSNMFETPAISRRQIALKIAPGLHVQFWSCNFGAEKIASSCRDKSRLCKRAFR